MEMGGGGGEVGAVKRSLLLAIGKAIRHPLLEPQSIRAWLGRPHFSADRLLDIAHNMRKSI